ncbi:hypothetical protein Tco_0091328 [Tanacetum coccineum]
MAPKGKLKPLKAVSQKSTTERRIKTSEGCAMLIFSVSFFIADYSMHIHLMSQNAAKMATNGGGHANLLCIVPILSDVPEGTRVADRERGPLLSFEELVNDNTSNACKQQKICNNVASCDTVLPTESAELREMRAEYEKLLLQFGQLGRKAQWVRDRLYDQRMVIKLYIVQDFKRDQLCSCHLSGLEYLERICHFKCANKKDLSKESIIPGSRILTSLVVRALVYEQVLVIRALVHEQVSGYLLIYVVMRPLYHMLFIRLPLQDFLARVLGNMVQGQFSP